MRPDRSHLTARAHPNVLSLPVRRLIARWWPGQPYCKSTVKDPTILDYGCGYGDDVDWLRKCEFKVAGYDPHFAPDRDRTVLTKRYDIVLCTYVFNTIPYREWRLALQAKLYDRVKKSGAVYISVRRGDQLTGWREKGTWQGSIQMGLPKVFEDPSTVIYAMRPRNFPFPPFTR